LAAERRHGDFVRALIAAGRVSAVHDCSDGGLAVALAEMALAGGIGVQLVDLAPSADALSPALPLHAFLFGEDQARYMVTLPEADCAALVEEARAAGILAQRLGTTGGDNLLLPGELPLPLATLAHAHQDWLPGFMNGNE
jgi:phosphoribosylformylglycinamidine synthase